MIRRPLLYALYFGLPAAVIAAAAWVALWGQDRTIGLLFFAFLALPILTGLADFKK